MTLSLSGPQFELSCTCPYDGPRECKHVVAVLFSLTDGITEDEGERIEAVLDEPDTTELRAFLREELARDGAMLDRFFAEFDATSGKSHETYRDDVTNCSKNTPGNTLSSSTQSISLGSWTSENDTRIRGAIGKLRGLPWSRGWD